MKKLLAFTLVLFLMLSVVYAEGEWTNGEYSTSPSTAKSSINLLLDPGNASLIACGFSSNSVREETYPSSVSPLQNNRYEIDTDGEVGESITPKASDALYLYWYVVSTVGVTIRLKTGGPLVNSSDTANAYNIPFTLSWPSQTTSGSTATLTSAATAATEIISLSTVSGTTSLINNFGCILIGIALTGGNNGNYYGYPSGDYASSLTVEAVTT